MLKIIPEIRLKGTQQFWKREVPKSMVSASADLEFMFAVMINVFPSDPCGKELL